MGYGPAMALMAAGILAASTPVPAERELALDRVGVKKFNPKDWRESPKPLTKRQKRRLKGKKL